MVPTKRLWFVLAIGIPVGILAGVLGHPWLWVVYNLVAFGLAWIDGRMTPKASALTVSRTMDSVLSARVPNKVVLSIVNNGPEPLACRLRDEPPPNCVVEGNEFQLALAPGSETERTYTVTPQVRGAGVIDGTYVRTRSPFGLVEVDASLGNPEPVRVYPNVLAMREFDLLKQRGRLAQAGIRRSSARGLGMEFESLREYSQDDDFRKIDWKATARRGKLIVRQFEQERNQSVIVCIDVGRHMLAEADGVAKLDHVLDATLLFAHAAHVAGDCVGLLVYSDTVRRFIPPRKGRSQMGAVIEAIHDLVAEPVASDPARAFAYLDSRWKRRSLVLAFGDVADVDEAAAFAAAFSPISKKHYAVFGSIGDPALRELAEAAVTDEASLHRKAAGIFVGTERRQGQSVLSAKGIRVVDSEPQDLSAALVSAYFEAKERSLV